jgi:hypothetical protein
MKIRIKIKAMTEPRGVRKKNDKNENEENKW